MEQVTRFLSGLRRFYTGYSLRTEILLLRAGRWESDGWENPHPAVKGF